MNSSHLNGSVTFNIIYTAMVCNPKKGDILYCNIVEINKLAIYILNVIRIYRRKYETRKDNI